MRVVSLLVEEADWTVPFPKKETGTLWTGYFIMPHTEKLHDLHGRQMVNVVSGETFHIYDSNTSRLPKPAGWLSLKTMEDEINRILSRPRASSALPTAARARARRSGCLCAGISSEANFTT